MALLWQRELGIRRNGPDAPPRGQYQRRGHRRDGPTISLGHTRRPPGRGSWIRINGAVSTPDLTLRFDLRSQGYRNFGMALGAALIDDLVEEFDNTAHAWASLPQI